MYTRLNSHSSEIRILRLHPGSHDEDIKCSLFTSTTTAPFEALSYVWGSSEDLVNIYVEGKLWPVTKNLKAALRDLRTDHTTRDLWVDAICINQNDKEERKHQVAMMDVIYRSAQMVIAWLGASINKEAWSLISTFSTAPDRHWDSVKHPDACPDSFVRLLVMYIVLRDTEWFQRIWTVQEAVLAKSIVYVYGSRVLENGEITTLIRSFNNHFSEWGCCDIWSAVKTMGLGHLDRQISPFFKMISTMTEISDKRGTLMPFLDIASKFRYRKATDPRDKIFGILGLTQGLTKDIIDYNTPVSTVYARATVQLINETRNLDVLSHVLPTYSESGKNLPDLPSWSPDWQWDYSGQYWLLDSVLQRRRYSTFFNACGNSSTPQEQDATIDYRQLTLVGYQCGYIDRIGSSFQPQDGRDVNYYAPADLMEWRDMTNVDRSPQQAYGTSSFGEQKTTILDAFWRTLCGNIDPFSIESANIQQANDGTRICHDIWWWTVLQQNKYDMFEESPISREKFMGFWDHVNTMAAGRRFFISNEGLMGLVSADAQVGDQVWVVNGGNVPLVIRPLSSEHDNFSGNKFTFVGDSYVHGIMNGEMSLSQISQKEIVLL